MNSSYLTPQPTPEEITSVKLEGRADQEPTP